MLNYSRYRSASECEGFPYGFPKMVCYFMLSADGQPQQMSRFRDEFRREVAASIEVDLPIYAVWPGQYSSDLFLIDKPELLAEAIAP